MGFLKSLAIDLAKGTRWCVEKLNLKTDHHLKGNLSGMSDKKLISIKGSTVRSVSSSVTGILLNTALSVACPIFIVPTAISAIQLAVSATNCHRARSEIKRRNLKEIPELKAHLSRRGVVIDVAIGATVKAAFTVLAAGIVGFDHVVDNFAQLAHKGGEHVVQNVVAQQAGDIVMNNTMNESVGPIVQHTPDRAADFQLTHPHLAKVDSGIHKAVAGVGDKFTDGIQHTTHMQIDQTTSWENLKLFIANGASRAMVFAQAAVVGVVGEFTQFINQALEIGNDEVWKNRAEKTVEDAQNRAEKTIEASQNLRRSLHGNPLISRAEQEVQLTSELKDSRSFKKRQMEMGTVS